MFDEDEEIELDEKNIYGYNDKNFTTFFYSAIIFKKEGDDLI